MEQNEAIKGTKLQYNKGAGKLIILLIYMYEHIASQSSRKEGFASGELITGILFFLTGS